MKRICFLWAVLAALILPTRAAVPAAEQLLPADTLAVISVPDWTKASSYFETSPYGKLWADPAMKPFRDHFEKKLKEQALVPLEKELGIKLADYQGLARGQFTLAATQNGWDGQSENQPGILLLVDTKEKSGELKTKLAELRKKWVDAGKSIKTERIRDLEFSTIVIQQKDLGELWKKVSPKSAALAPGDDDEEEDEDEDEADPKPGANSKKPAKEQKIELTIGQADSLFIVGTAPKAIEKIVARLAGASVPTLAELPAFEANRAALFRDAMSFAWVNTQPVVQTIQKQLAEAGKGGRQQGMFPAPRMDKALDAIGLGGLKSIAIKAGGNAEGGWGEVFLSVPESNRQGLFKILAAEAKDASAPAFVPADAVKFTRWRLDGQKTWATIETTLTAIAPEMAGILQMGLATIGKDKDPNFDAKKNLIGNLGNDIVSYQKKPRSSSFADLNAPPSLVLVGSPNPEALSQAARAATSLMPMATGEAPVKEREFLGRKVYSLALPDSFSPEDGKPIKRSLSFAASAGYVAFTTDAAMLDEFLRSNEGTGKSLRDVPGLAEAAQRVGGMNSGFFTFENQRETMRVYFDAAKSGNEALAKLAARNGLPSGKANGDDGDESGLLDFSLLPPFDRVAQYFHFEVSGQATSPDGLGWKVFSPTPPQMRSSK